KLKKLAKEFAIVQCSEYDEKSGIPFVTIDHEKAAYDAVNHLIELGHQNILFINSDEKFLYARQREAGYRRALQENKVSIQENNLINTGGLSFQLGQQAMASVLNR